MGGVGGCISSSVGVVSQGTVGLCLCKGFHAPDQKQADQGPFVLFKKFPVLSMFDI